MVLHARADAAPEGILGRRVRLEVPWLKRHQVHEWEFPCRDHERRLAGLARLHLASPPRPHRGTRPSPRRARTGGRACGPRCQSVCTQHDIVTSRSRAGPQTLPRSAPDWPDPAVGRRRWTALVFARESAYTRAGASPEDTNKAPSSPARAPRSAGATTRSDR
jgi:hypothetical protein